jgi:threonine dehydrogenase-like Zn-dependent dehydrogenase
MKQAILYGVGDLRIEDVPLDAGSLQLDQIYVETEVTALSTGTDLGNYSGDATYVPGAPRYPRWVGYSNVGVIRRVGVHVEKLKPGMRVFSLRPHQSAYIAQQTELLVPVPASLSSEEASLAYLTHLGLASLRQARFEPGENVAIIGLGVIGLCTVWLAGAMGAKVVGISNSKIRSESALKLGAHAAFLAEERDLSPKLGEVFGEVGTDIVVLTANPWNAYRLAMEIARFGGRVSILGFPGRAQEPPDFNPMDPQWVYGKQLTLLGAGFAPKADCRPEDLRFNTRRNLEYILDLMAFHHPRIESVISHRLPASRMKEAYELAREHSKDLVSAVFDWRVPE